ncbi:hypothetical protein [Streptomyces lunalinharesii]|uniref:Uncharacterized protein n=1 Tax=Streptomyces lunalinharesii TaxID=333384 RepID=A0ABP6EYT3_9ACTN
MIEEGSVHIPIRWFQAKRAADAYLKDVAATEHHSARRAARDVIALTLLLTHLEGYDTDAVRGRPGRLRHRVATGCLWYAWCDTRLATVPLAEASGPDGADLVHAARAWEYVTSASAVLTSRFPGHPDCTLLAAWEAGLRVARGALDTLLLAEPDCAALIGRAIRLGDEYLVDGGTGRLIEVIWHPEHLLGHAPSAPLAYRIATADGKSRILPDDSLRELS